MYALLMLSNSLKMIKIDRNTSEVSRILSKKCSVSISVFVGCIICMEKLTAPC